MSATTTRHADRVREAFAAFNAGDAAGYASQYAEDARVIGPFFPEPLVGRAEIEQTTIAMAAAFPDMRWSVVTMLEDGDRVACEIHIEGTHQGPLPTPAGEIPATGKTVSFDVGAVYEFNEDGKVSELREYMDPGALMAQLGLGAG